MAEANGVEAAPKGPFDPRTTEEVLLEEYEWLTGSVRPGGIEDYYRTVRNEGQAALCLSGGGIRSAAFALGVLQALSRKGVLTGFRYLSTVSGGGYIGSWLQRWIHEEGDAEKVMIKLGAVEEPDQIKRLRENSNFLTPRAGLGSNDTWTAVALTLRNIIVNWLLFLPALLLIAMLPNWFLSGIESVPRAVVPDPWFDEVLLGLASVSIAVSVFFTVPMLPSYSGRYRIKPGDGDGWIFLRIVLPIIMWSIFGTLAVSAQLFGIEAKGGGEQLPAGLLLAAATFGGMLAGWLAGSGRVALGHHGTFSADIIIWLLSFAVVAGWILLGAQLFEGAMGATAAPPAGAEAVPGVKEVASAARPVEASWAHKMLTMLGPLWLLTATMLAAVFFVAFRWSEGSKVKPDADREWIARISGLKFKPMLAWALAAFAVLLLGPLLRSWVGGELSVSALVALVAGGGAVAGGRSGGSGDLARKGRGYVVRFLPLQGLITLATLLFLVSLFLLLGGLENRFARLIQAPLGKWMNEAGLPGWIDHAVVAHTVLLLLLASLLLFLGRMIPVNRFSLNGLYRNRLARGFLGAARSQRDPNPFTGFDSYDNIRLHHLTTEGANRSLYPVINAALNVTSTENLAWQERKAGPFIFTPLYSGSSILDSNEPKPVEPRKKEPDPVPDTPDHATRASGEPQVVTDGGQAPGGATQDPDPASRARQSGAYVCSSNYAGSEPDLALGTDTCGVTLATAMSISGAAASPNMGYHSSPATAFLMTLFNVRLGAWLPNPARAKALGPHIARSSPEDSLRALLRELAGSTDDKGLDVYLSDGGHFENLGIYEMLRRRCRYIFVSDAGADPECAFADLGNAVRKAKIDLDIDVDFGRMCISSRTREIDPQLAWAMGKVSYPEGGGGVIVYVKPSLFGKRLPVDVVSYAAVSDTFPHESTADQWFSESQFESYRRLGEHFVSRIGFGAPSGSIPALFAQAYEQYAETIGQGAADQRFLNAVRKLTAWPPDKAAGETEPSDKA